MEIFTLVKANIRKKKSSFISIVILMTIVVASIVTILGVKKNYQAGMERAYETSDVGEIVALVKKREMTDELKKKVEESSLVERVVYYDAILYEGLTVGETRDPNVGFLLEMHEGIELYNENFDGFVEEIPKLQQGEVYLPLGSRGKLSCDIGDTIEIAFMKGMEKEFEIKGFVQEPVMGAAMIGFKQMFISKEDYDAISKECHGIQTEDISFDMTIMNIHQSPNSELSPAQFQRELNLETNIIATSLAALTLDQSKNYSMLVPDMILNIVLVFAIFLFVIVLIVMGHSISTEIEIDYVALGVLKSQGFTKEKLRQLFLWQYGLAELIGILLGCVLAIPLKKMVGIACQAMVGTLPASEVINATSVLLIFGIVLVSFILIHISTTKVVSISPVRAILGGREQIYFDHLLQLPIAKKALAVSLAFRQVTSGKKRYVGVVLIVAILTFFMISVSLLGDLLFVDDAYSMMGLVAYDIQVQAKTEDMAKKWEQVDEQIEAYSKCTDVNSVTNGYMSLNGENLACEVYEYPETIPGLLEGRLPLYDNEILITEFVAESLNLKMGDEVTVSEYDKEATYIISGIHQTMSDVGMAFAMNKKGKERLRGEDITFYYRYYVLEDKTQLDAIEKMLQEEYGDDLEVEVYTEENNPITSMYSGIVTLLQIIIDVFSLIFVAVAVRMVCTKVFLQERTDIGIYKAIGFTSGKLRMQFAMRFFLVALVGAMFGILLSVLASRKAIGLVMRFAGVSKLALTFTVESLLVPVLIVSVSCMVFAFVAAKKIKKVEVRELVVE
ncbi:MAG: FtsX-like permease family protein [Lachnospiraceae bacterium]|nr:FtsX-like permease family protein [Lachnospiraceae bacterium]